jgi:hypothetical protein
MTPKTSPSVRSMASSREAPSVQSRGPRGKRKCANEECDLKVRVEPKALNWQMFYLNQNEWGYLKEDGLSD